jgi:hypothetical protein
MGGDFGHNQKNRLEHLGDIRKAVSKEIQTLQKLCGPVSETVLACKEDDLYFLCLFVDLMDKEGIDNVLGDVLTFISVVHKARQISVHVSSVGGLEGDRRV